MRNDSGFPCTRAKAHRPLIGILVFALSMQTGCAQRFSDNGNQQLLMAYLGLSARWLSYNPAVVSGLRFWVRAESISQADNTSVTSWTDLSGTGNTVTAGTPPSFSTTTSAINGRPVVHFSGTSLLSKASPIGMPATDSGSIFAVLRPNSAGMDILIFGSCGNQARQFSISTTAIAPTKTCVTQAILANFSWPIGVVHEVAWLQNGTTYIEVRADGNMITSGVPAVTAYGSGALNLSNSSNMDLAELLIYDNQVSSADARNIECYLGARYGTRTCP